MSRHITKFLVGGAAFLPMVALAQGGGGLAGFIATIGGLVGMLFPIVIALALLFFFWALAMFLMNSGDETARSTARQQMIYGIIVLFVIVSVWGLVQILSDTFDVEQGGSLENIPGVDGVSG